MMTMVKTNVTIMRGGTSKGVFFHESAMPNNKNEWEPFLLDVMGSPDKRQIDGLGGGNSLTSKVAIIKKAYTSDIDVLYTFGQVSILEEKVDFKGNCGNISAAVGPFAIEEGLVKATEPMTTVRILNTNTNKMIVAEVEVEDGQVKYDGDVTISGVPGSGSPIYLNFHNAAGSVTGHLLPTGNSSELLDTSQGPIEVSIIDYANPLVFVEASSIGLDGTELAEEFTDLQLAQFEELRSIAAEKCGFASRFSATKLSPAVPKLAIVSKPEKYKDSTGAWHSNVEMDLHIRMMSMQKPHQALAVTGAICTTRALSVEGTIPARIAKIHSTNVRVAHPSGIIETMLEPTGIKIVRTARRIMDGTVYTHGDYQMM
jgi:2-methylaconitate cis-trans-isomerase PrpF